MFAKKGDCFLLTANMSRSFKNYQVYIQCVHLWRKCKKNVDKIKFYPFIWIMFVMQFVMQILYRPHLKPIHPNKQLISSQFLDYLCRIQSTLLWLLLILSLKSRVILFFFVYWKPLSISQLLIFIYIVKIKFSNNNTNNKKREKI